MTEKTTSKHTRKKYKFRKSVFNTCKKVMTVIKDKGTFSALDFANDHEALEVINNMETLRQVLFILQEGTDRFMKETQEKLNDPRRSIQQLAQDTLDIATAIIEAEKCIRQAELHGLSDKTQGRMPITFA